MKKIAFFDTKPYDRESFDRLNNGRYEIKYFETRLTAAALPLADWLLRQVREWTA